MKRVQVLLVGGFLGSGKTTHVRHLLNSAIASGQKLAVISNEFGELGIDEALLESESQGFVELAGGCVCCKLSDELSETLQDIYERVQPDCIAIETSGVALPSDAQLTLFREPVCEWISDEAVVVVVNADQLKDRLASAQAQDIDDPYGSGEDLTFEFQVSAADLLLLNKVDLLEEDSAPLHALLQEMNPGVPIFETVQGQIAPELLFPPDAHRLRQTRKATKPVHDHDHDHAHFVSQVHDIPENLTLAAAKHWVTERQGLRTKGFVQTTDKGWHVIQGVGRRMEVTHTDTTPPPEVQNKLVVINYRQ